MEKQLFATISAAKVHPTSFNVALISPHVNDIIKGVIDNIIDIEIRKIQESQPQLVIIEE